MSFYPELDGLSLAELVACFHGPPHEEPEYADTWYMKVTGQIAQQGAPGLAFLHGAFDEADTPRLRALLFALATAPQPDAALQERLRQYLRDERPLIVMEAVDGLSSQGVRAALDQVLALGEHRSPYVRGSVLRFLRRLHPDKALPLLLEALHDPHFIVRENAVDELDEFGAVEALPLVAVRGSSTTRVT